MNVPINCPICGDPLTNKFNDTNDKVLYKNCRQRPDHIFSCAIFIAGFFNRPTDRVERLSFTLSMNPILSVEVYPVSEDNKIMSIGKSAPTETAALANAQKLPFYVEPDFTDYPKLVRKIKTYLLFS